MKKSELWRGGDLFIASQEGEPIREETDFAPNLFTEKYEFIAIGINYLASRSVNTLGPSLIPVIRPSSWRNC